MIWTKKTNDQNVFYHVDRKKKLIQQQLYLLVRAILLISQLISQPTLISSKSRHCQKRLKERANLIMILAVLSCRLVDKAASQNKIKKKCY